MSAICDRVIVVGWDGLRPDMISPDLTPTLCRMIGQGTRFRDATAVFPSETRPNNAAIGTGCQPGRHGITANHLHLPEAAVRPYFDTGDHVQLGRLFELRGRIVPVETLGERLSAAGHRFAVVGSGSPGQTLLQNPTAAGYVINRAFRLPETLDDTLASRFGPIPDRTAGSATIDAYLHRTALEYVVPELAPSALILWSNEPDGSLHAHGLGTVEVAAALRANDARLTDLLAWLERSDAAERTTLLFLSDHGHATVRRRIDIRAEMRQSGLLDGLTDEDVTVIAAGVQLDNRAVDRLDDVVAWLTRRDWCGPVFVHDDRWDASLIGAAPASKLWGDAVGPWVPTIQFSFAWDDLPNACGVPGHADVPSETGPRTRTSHGSLSRWEMGSVLAMAGAGVRRGAAVAAPAGPADVAPTVLHLLGLDASPTMQGRALVDALDGGTDAPTVTTEPILEGDWGHLVRRRVDGAAYLAVEPRS